MRYTVIGIVQIFHGGEWHEEPVLRHIRATGRAQAAQDVLSLFCGDYVRWHTPELVRVLERS